MFKGPFRVSKSLSLSASNGSWVHSVKARVTSKVSGSTITFVTAPALGCSRVTVTFSIVVPTSAISKDTPTTYTLLLEKTQ